MGWNIQTGKMLFRNARQLFFYHAYLMQIWGFEFSPKEWRVIAAKNCSLFHSVMEDIKCMMLCFIYTLMMCVMWFESWILCKGSVVTNDIREQRILSYQTFFTFPSLPYLSLSISLYQFMLPYQSFDVLSNFCHLLAHCYLLTFYVIFSPYKCTCCSHHKHNSLSVLACERSLRINIYF